MSVFLTSCSDENDTKVEESVNLNTKQTFNWSKQEITTEDGKSYLEVKLKDEVFRVPKEYVAQNSADKVFFDIIPQWPDMLPISKEKNYPKYHPITIRFFSKLSTNNPESFFNDSYHALERALANPKICSELLPSKLFSGLLQCGENTGLSYFQIAAEAIKTPSGNPVVAPCHLGSGNDKFRRLTCRVRIKWSENLSFQYDLIQHEKDHHLLEKFKEVHIAITQLVESFYGD